MLEHLLTPISEAWLAQYADVQNAERYGTVMRLRMPKIFVIIGCFALTLAILLIFQLLPDTQVAALVLSILACCALFVAGLIPLLYGLNHEVLISEERFSTKGPWHGTRTFEWTSVQKGKYSYYEKAMILTMADGSRVRIGVYLRGGKLFWRTLRERAGVSVGDWGLPYDYRR